MRLHVMRYGVSCIVLVILYLAACHSPSRATSNKTRVVTVATEVAGPTLFYSGVIHPLKSTVIVAPAEGVVDNITFHYGDVVKAGQPLFYINSEKFSSDYKAALMDYIKAKNEFSTNQTQLKEGDFLHKNELISDDEFKTRQSNFYNAQLTLLQAKNVLTHLLKQLHRNDVNVLNVAISNIDAMSSALHLQADTEKLTIISPADGVALLPIKSDGASDKKIVKGDTVKQGDVLALVGDAKGFSVQISVNEFDINELQIGQVVSVSGPAFSDTSLQGKITGVDHQAQLNQNGIPTFSADVEVTQLTPEQQSHLHVGMSAKVEVHLAAASQVIVPINAVTEKNGLMYVKVQNTKTKSIEELEVKTGKTTIDSVAILTHLKAGDKIVVPA